MTTTHPSRGDLAAFVAGRVDDTLMVGIETHLAGCEACRVAMKTIPPDGLESLIREAVNVAQEHREEVTNGEGRKSCDTSAALHDHPRYRVLGVIGAGGMGTVYRAEHRLMRRQVALKVISPKMLSRPDAVVRFRREVEAVAKLSHPNIATAFDAEQVGDSLVLVTELVEGHNLAQVVRNEGPLSIARACEYVRQAAMGLQHAHDRGIVHRDIKPSNLMLTPNGVVKILDFGLAALGEHDECGLADTPVGSTKLNGSLTDYGEAFGTPDFVAPEQRRDAHAVDARADIYSLGRTLRFLLTGDANADRRRQAEAVRLAAVIERMTEPELAGRYQTAAQVVEAMLPFLQKRTTRRRWLIAVGLTGMIGMGLLAWQWESHRPGNTVMLSSYMHFGRSTDTVVLPGRVELDTTCTIEAHVMLTTDAAKDWCVFDQWESGKEDIYYHGLEISDSLCSSSE
ncbi:MAG: serine/threonine protein kinase [Gemmataceae bacterium]|nr:serine/threonine protein kinase [Gemmataceae bacterium]